MDFTDVIIKRRSHRKFTQDTISDEKIKKIIEAGRLAPTWANKQGVNYIIVKNRSLIKEMANGINQKWTENAPILIVVCIEPNRSGKNINGLEYFTVDAAICMEHIVLAATNEGLGTCWIGLFDEQKIKKTLSIPEKVRVIALTPLGYSRYTPREQKRKSIDQICFSEKWGNNIKF
ncbi:nitroreductase family protein [Promethearchaeum syntrophicum]|uniref:Nitroreductase family protein n=1 Tax=Promethearchaeum syntrophicum TaxID=2594042 RepID=A0A5B9D743_9ARCH|nr:nitroreductase family protein [Candidatus Prometheoarchaeum syntrophicum]QEE14660.1 nitroreductase A [Candidatus Prometheoarchaeum syntrophicum]